MASDLRDDSPWRLLRDGGRPLAALLLLALAIKLICVAAARSDDPLTHVPTSDSRYYLDRAAGLAGLHDDPLADEPYHMPPGYPWVLALVPGAPEGHTGGVLVLQALVGTALLAGVWVLARRRLSRPAAFTCVALCLAYAPLTFFELKLLGDSLATALLVGVLLQADGLERAPTAWRAGLLGLLTGLTALLRPQALLLAPLLALWVWRRRGPLPAAALVVGAALALAPSTLHNLHAGGGLTPVSDNGGINLYIAQSGPPSGTFLVLDEAFGDIERQAASAQRLAESQAGRALARAEVSGWFTRRALGLVADDPLLFLRRVGLRARALVETFETGIVTIPQVEAGVIPPLALLALPFGALLAAAGAALVLGARRVLAGATAWPAWCVAAMVVTTALIFFHYSRFRLPLIPLLALLVGAGVDAVRTSRPAVARAALAVLVAAGLGALSWWPGPHHPQTLANGWASLAEARLALAAPGDTEALAEAAEDVARALEHDPGFVRARLLSARIAFLDQRFDDCVRDLDATGPALADHVRVLELRLSVALHPAPGNGHRDVDRARELLTALQLHAATDPSLSGRLAFYEQQLSQLEEREGQG